VLLRGLEDLAFGVHEIAVSDRSPALGSCSCRCHPSRALGVSDAEQALDLEPKRRQVLRESRVGVEFEAKRSEVDRASPRE
jgi:hypothetical protein